MDPQFKTSFIPKKPILDTTSELRTSAPINLFSLLSTILFIVVIFLGGGVFFYKSILADQIGKNKEVLERAKDAFEPELIEQIIRLDSRIETSKKLLSSHLALTPFFDFLSTVTLRTVRFRDFSFAYLAPDKIMVEMKGEAQSYASVALQSDLLNSQKFLKDTVVGDMSLEPTGTVSFRVTSVIDPSLVSYAQSLARNMAPSDEGLDLEIEAEPTATTTTP
jgi:hypothetical protein